jgi:transcriptional regulator with XRE-family HTH domain
MAKLIPFKRPRTFTTHERFIEEVQHRIFSSQLTYNEIANQADVAKTTVANLARGKTQWPRPKTLFGIIKALGLRLELH